MCSKYINRTAMITRSVDLSLSLWRSHFVMVALRMSMSSLVRRRSSDEITNSASVSSSLFPAFGTTIFDIEGYLKSNLRKYVIAPYDRRYQYVFNVDIWIYLYMHYYTAMWNCNLWYIICRLWQTFLVALVVYSAWASPFELAFRELLVGSLLPVDLLVDAFFAVDIILTFFVAYLDTSTYLLVDDHKKIALRCVCHAQRKILLFYNLE